MIGGTNMIKDRTELFGIKKWADIEAAYYGTLTFLKNGDPAEQCGAKNYHLHRAVPFLEMFWRCHIAPATNRPTNEKLADGVNRAVSLMAERSYEVFGNLLDAHDELASTDLLHPPRYRRCLNVLLYAGNALQLFTELVQVIEADPRYYGQRGLAAQLYGARTKGDSKTIEIFTWSEWQRWKDKRHDAICYRDMLVHHGRPWFFFPPERDFKEEPEILAPKYRSRTTWHESWSEQLELYKTHRNRFQPLTQVCRDTLNLTERLLNEAYQRVVERLAPLLDEPRYRELWRWH